MERLKDGSKGRMIVSILSLLIVFISSDKSDVYRTVDKKLTGSHRNAWDPV